MKTANELLSKYEVIAYEDLNIKGLAKTRLSDTIFAVKAEKAGQKTIAVNPNGTS